MQCVSAKTSVILNQISVVCHSERNASLLSHTHLSLFHTINLNAQWSILFCHSACEQIRQESSRLHRRTGQSQTLRILTPLQCHIQT